MPCSASSTCTGLPGVVPPRDARTNTDRIDVPFSALTPGAAAAGVAMVQMVARATSSAIGNLITSVRGIAGAEYKHRRCAAKGFRSRFGSGPQHAAVEAQVIGHVLDPVLGFVRAGEDVPVCMKALF